VVLVLVLVLMWLGLCWLAVPGTGPAGARAAMSVVPV